MAYSSVVASRIGGPEVIDVIKVDSLPEPRHNEVRIKMLASSAAFTNLLICKGKYPGVKSKPPFTLGYDVVGVIDKLGRDSQPFEIG